MLPSDETPIIMGNKWLPGTTEIKLSDITIIGELGCGAQG